MSYEFEDIKPGDLITSNFMTSIINAIESLDDRVIKLEEASSEDNKVAIIELDPKSGPYRVGQEMKILGRNFEYSIGAHRLYFDATNVAVFKPDSSDSKLIFDIPEVLNIPVSGKTVLLTLKNRSSTDSRFITLMPKKEPLAGSIIVDSYHTVEEGTITPNQTATFKFNLKSGLNQPARFVISPFISIDTNQQEWQERLRVLDKNKIEINEIILNNGENQDFYIRITSIPSGTDGQVFSLTVDATADSIKGSSLLESYTVGQPPDEVDTSIHPNITSVVDPQNNNAPLPPGDYVTETKTVKRAINQAALIRVNTLFDAPGNYDITVSLENGSNWNVRLVNPIPTNGGNGEYNGISAGTTKIIEFGVGPLAGASSSGKVKFSIKRKDLAFDRPFFVNLELKQS